MTKDGFYKITISLSSAQSSALAAWAGTLGSEAVMVALSSVIPDFNIEPILKHYLTVSEVAEIKQVSEQSVRDILRSSVRRAAIFPNARFVGTKERGIWQIPQDEVAAWNPRTYRRIKE